MMTCDQWKTGILNAINEIQDIEFQNRVWLGGRGPEVSSWDEVMCRFFDDYDIDGFLQLNPSESGLPEKQYEELKKLRDMLNVYCKQVGETPSAKFILSDPRWLHIVMFAKQTLEIFHV